MLAATVCSRRTSDSPNAFSRSKLSTEIAAISRSPTMTGTKTQARLASVPSTVLTPHAAMAAWSPITTGRPACSSRLIARSGLYGIGGSDVSRTPCS